MAQPPIADTDGGAIQASAARHGVLLPIDAQIRNPMHDKLNDLRDRLRALAAALFDVRPNVPSLAPGSSAVRLLWLGQESGGGKPTLQLIRR